MFFTSEESIRRIIDVTRAGRKVANAFQGKLAETFVEERIRGKSAEEKERISRNWENIFQLAREIEQVVVPSVSELFAIVAEKTPRVYKGVSYNPLVPSYGENMNILDFFSWLAAGDFKGVVLDASLYAVVNAGQTPLVERYSAEAAAAAVSFLKAAMKRYPEIIESAKTRGRYLRAASLSLFSSSTQPIIVDAEMLWESKRYLECIQAAIAFCAEKPKEGDFVELVKYAKYTRYNTSYQRWYSVLVLAEALYLYDVYGVDAKLGPTTESNFDNLIRDFMKSIGIPYGFIWYDRSIEKRIPYPEFIFFADDAGAIEQKLKNEELRQWVNEITKPFGLDPRQIIARVNECAARNPPKLDVEGE